MLREIQLCCSICWEFHADYDIFRCNKKNENYCIYCLQELWKKPIKPPGCRLCRNKYFSRCSENLYNGKFDFYKEMNICCKLLELEEWLTNKFKLSESSVNTKARTYVENKMSEAIIKTCTKCKVRFIKDDANCNIISCICGHTICYICEKPATQCDNRFNCLENSSEVDEEKIMDAAKEAKKVVGNYLLYDPTISENSSQVISRNARNVKALSFGITSLLFYVLYKHCN